MGLKGEAQEVQKIPQKVLIKSLQTLKNSPSKAHPSRNSPQANDYGPRHRPQYGQAYSPRKYDDNYVHQNGQRSLSQTHYDSNSHKVHRPHQNGLQAHERSVSNFSLHSTQSGHLPTQRGFPHQKSAEKLSGYATQGGAYDYQIHKPYTSRYQPRNDSSTTSLHRAVTSPHGVGANSRAKGVAVASASSILAKLQGSSGIGGSCKAQN